MPARAAPLDYLEIFERPREAFDDPEAVEVLPLPALRVASGALVGLDPRCIGAYDLDYAPYARTIRPGLYPGLACVDRATSHVAATLLRLRRAPVDRWVLATPSAEDLAGLSLHRPGTPYGYECRGIMGLGDARALEAASRRPEGLRAALEAALFRGDAPPFAAIDLDAAPDLDVNLWAALAHDGGPVRAYWGLDAHGDAIALASDAFTSFHRARPRRR